MCLEELLYVGMMTLLIVGLSKKRVWNNTSPGESTDIIRKRKENVAEIFRPRDNYQPRPSMWAQFQGFTHHEGEAIQACEESLIVLQEYFWI